MPGECDRVREHQERSSLRECEVESDQIRTSMEHIAFVMHDVLENSQAFKCDAFHPKR